MSFEFLAVFSFYCVFVFVCTLSVPLYLFSLFFIWTVLSEINDLITSCFYLLKSCDAPQVDHSASAAVQCTVNNRRRSCWLSEVHFDLGTVSISTVITAAADQCSTYSFTRCCTVLRQLWQIRHSVQTDTFQTLTVSLVQTRPDVGNSVLD